MIMSSKESLNPLMKKAFLIPINHVQDHLVKAVAYNIPKKVDYKSYPLEKLEVELLGMGYTQIITIASEGVVFPNGPLEWFEKRGYHDLEEVSFEQNEGARLHLLKKALDKKGGN